MQVMREVQVQPLIGKDPWSRKWQFTPVFLPGKSQGLSEGPKLLHFVDRKTPLCKVPGKEPLEIPLPHPTILEPVGPQTKIS